MRACVPPAAKLVEDARAFAKAKGIRSIRAGCTCSKTRPEPGAAAKGKCWVPCTAEAMRAATERKLHSLGLYPAGKSLPLDVYIMARNIKSEAGSGTGAEKLAIGEALVNRARAKGQSLQRIALYNGRYFGAQWGSNPAVASRQDPHWEDIVAADLVIGGRSGNIARGATHYFGPRAQDAMARAGKDAKDRWGVVHKWHGYDYGSLKGWGRPVQWVGQIPGIDIERQMLFRSVSSVDPGIFEAAKAALRPRATPSEILHASYCAPGIAGIGKGTWLAAAGLVALGAGAYYFLRYRT